MAIFRVVWEFSGVGGAGWNEVYYKEAADAAAAASVTAGLAQARLRFLHPLCRLVRVRSSDTTALRITGGNGFNLAGTAIMSSPIDDGPSVAGDAIICALGAAPRGSRKIWLRGAPDSYIRRSGVSGQDDPTAGLLDLFTTWFSALAANSYGIRALTPQTLGPYGNIKILQVNGVTTPGVAVVTTATPPQYIANDRVIIGGASKKDLPYLNGRWTVLEAVVGNTFKIAYQTPQSILVPGGNAHVRKEGYTAVNVFSPALCSFAYFGTRTTKNPASHSRGARRAVRLRTSL